MTKDEEGRERARGLLTVSNTVKKSSFTMTSNSAVVVLLKYRRLFTFMTSYMPNVAAPVLAHH